MSYYTPFSNSDDVRDVDNHPEHRHWWERAPKEWPRRRGRRGRYTAPDSNSNSPYQSGGDFVHNPNPDEVNRIGQRSDPAVAKYWETQEQRKVAAEARKQQRAAVRG
jgi:hypothetical protein